MASYWNVLKITWSSRPEKRIQQLAVVRSTCTLSSNDSLNGSHTAKLFRS